MIDSLNINIDIARLDAPEILSYCDYDIGATLYTMRVLLNEKGIKMDNVLDTSDLDFTPKEGTLNHQFIDDGMYFTNIKASYET